ncbi:MAG: hypothetical protein IKE48_02975 [Parasporobacterium sp.]|nr:hypothetical protein [Parasporobacterium sp.]
MNDIIQEIRSGNKDAVKSVYQEYAKDVYNFAKSITGDHDSALAATKKTFLTLFKNIQNGEEPSNIRTAALKLAYDEAYKMASPKAEAAAQEEVPAEEAPAEEPAYAEPMFQRRERKTPVQVEPEYDEYEEDYVDDYEEEDDGFVPPQRPQDADREEVYIPKGGYDTLKIEPVDVPEEEEAPVRPRRRRAPVVEEDYEEEAPVRQERPVRQRRPRQEEYDEVEYEEERPRQKKKAPKVDVYAIDENGDEYDDYYDDDYEEEEAPKPRNKGLFIFCIILNIILILILLWFLGGLLVNLGILPDIDLGYSWFNGHIYPLF